MDSDFEQLWVFTSNFAVSGIKNFEQGGIITGGET
jgi:hypothetical protein